MPYIKPFHRTELKHLADLASKRAYTEGDMNYFITRFLLKAMKVENLAQLKGDFNYASINAAVGVLECCKLELYRRLAAKYEDKKCGENGDII